MAELYIDIVRNIFANSEVVVTAVLALWVLAD